MKKRLPVVQNPEEIKYKFMDTFRPRFDLVGQPTADYDPSVAMATIMNNVEAVSDLDISMLFVALSYMDFEVALDQIIKAYKGKTGEEPSFDVVVLGEDLGTERDKIQHRLRMLKALREKSRYRDVIKSITVKSVDPKFVHIEPNVFSSGVNFEKIN